MVVLGVLAQGEDAVHDAIRYRELAINSPQEIAHALALYGGDSDEVRRSPPGALSHSPLPPSCAQPPEALSSSRPRSASHLPLPL